MTAAKLGSTQADWKGM